MNVDTKNIQFYNRLCRFFDYQKGAQIVHKT